MKKEIYDVYEAIKPDEDAKKRMLNNIQSMASDDKKRRDTVMGKQKSKKLLRVAAVAAAIVIVPTMAYAAGLFGLHEVSLGKKVIEVPQQKDSSAVSGDSPGLVNKEVDMISLQGFSDSPEYQACMEWTNFSDNYDTDGAILSEVGNEVTGFEKEYGNYLCYTQEMADKIEELCQKYQLQKLEGFTSAGADDYTDLLRQFGVGDICGKSSEFCINNVYDAYSHSNGTFQIDGMIVLTKNDGNMVDYQLRRSVKGYFDTTILNVGDINSYEEWEYTTEDGESLLLANSSAKALIIAEKEKSFIVVNILDSTWTDSFDVSREDLEKIAESFDFSVIP